MKLRYIILISIGGMFLSACAPIVPMGVVSPPDIIVTINAGNAEIVTTGDPKCKPQNQGVGCIKIGKGSTGLINFKLNAPPFWSFDAFEICKGTTNDNKVCNLNVWDRMEFIVTGDAGVIALIPDNAGMVDLKLLSADLIPDKADQVDLNDLPADVVPDKADQVDLNDLPADVVPDNADLVDLKDLPADVDSFILFDQNRIEQDYYYRVKVCNSNTTVCSWADPPLENEGIK